MGYSGYEWLWLFFAYSFSGWVLETVTAAVRQKRFVNRGLVNGPLCVIYGITGSALMLVCRDLRGIWLFLGSMIFSTLAEWIAGHVIEKMYHERWWDYSHVKWNLDGYICFPVSVIWGILGFVTMRWGAPLLIGVFRMIPVTPAHLVIWILSGILILDVAATLCILSGRSRRIRQWQGVDSWLTGVSSRLERRIYGWVDPECVPGSNLPQGASGRGRAEKDRLCLRTLFLQDRTFACCRRIFGRYRGDDLLPADGRNLDEPEQFCLGPVQHRLGPRYRPRHLVPL